MTAVCDETRTAERALRNGWLFAECPEQELREISALCAVMDVPAGGKLLNEHEPHDACYVVVSGAASVTRGGHDIGRVGEGAVLGTTALIDDGTSNVTAIAASDMRVLALQRAELVGYLARGGWSVRHRLDILTAETRRPERASVCAA
jgi:CRP-like cAMP-binding protein